MSAQTALPIADSAPPPGPCAWCGKPSVGVVEVEGPRFRLHGNVRVLARRAIEAPACRQHIDIVERQPKEAA